MSIAITMRATLIRAVALTLSTGIIASGCRAAAAADSAAGDHTAGTPGYDSGRVTTAAGAPVGGAEINFGGVSAAGSPVGLTVFTKPDGTYRVHLPPGNYDLAWAWAHVNGYAGRDWKLPLATDPVNLTDRDIAEGPVANLQFLIQGRTARGSDPTSPQSYYGGDLRVMGRGRFVYQGRPGTRFPDGGQVEVTLVPQGPLINGSAGKTLVLTAPASDPKFRDVPLGQYGATVRVLAANGAAQPVQVLFPAIGGTASDRATVTFNVSGVGGPNDHGTDTTWLGVQ